MAGWFFFALLVYTQPAAANSVEQRATYKAAWGHLNKGNWRSYLHHKQQLRDYPLLAYLEYEEIIRERQRQESLTELKGFLAQYPHFPSSSRIKTFLVEALYAKQDWAELVLHTDRQFMPCMHLAAANQMKHEHEALRDLAQVIWNRSTTLDTRCIGILRSAGFDFYTDADLVWHRIGIIVEHGKGRAKWQLVSSLRGYLDLPRRKSLDVWLKIRRAPRQIGRYFAQLNASPHACEVIAYALSHYPQDHAAEGYQWYQRYARKCRFTPQQQTDIGYHLGLQFILNGEKTGLKVMFSLNPKFMRAEQHAWRARSAIKFADWRKLVAILDGFPPALADESDWLFWRGYALEKLGRQNRAAEHYDRAAQQRNFYGFYAAERRSLRKKFDNTPADIEAGKAILRSAPFRRFVELRALGEVGKAHMEWTNLLRLTTNAQRLALAGFAYKQQEYYLAIRAFAEAGYWDDLQRRYPMPYRPLVEAAARANNLNPALIYAIMRTESAYQTNARSSAGAVGLMQVLPSTARGLARRYNYEGSLALTKPDVSIDIGSLYLRRLFDRYQDNVVLVLASYNAGPGAVNSWLPDKRPRPAIEWLETIPYGETRKYVRSVLFSRAIFGWRMGDNHFPLARFMPDIKRRYDG